MVTRNIGSVNNVTELKSFIYNTICRDHELLLNAFPTTETLLRRGNGETCGLMFCLHGPRAVKFTAIWEKERNRVLFYGPEGRRYAQALLDGEGTASRLEIPENMNHF